MTSSPTHIARWFVGMVGSAVFMLCVLGLTPQNIVDALPETQQTALAESAAAPFIELAVAVTAVLSMGMMGIALTVGAVQARWRRAVQPSPLFPSTTATVVLAASLAVFAGALHPALAALILLLWSMVTAGITTVSAPGQRYGSVLAADASGLGRVAGRLPLELVAVLFSDAHSAEGLLRGIHRELAARRAATPTPHAPQRATLIPGTQEG